MTLATPPVADADGLEAAYRQRLTEILALPAGAERAALVTAQIAWLDECRTDLTAIRDVDVWKLHNADGLGAHRIAAMIGLQKARAQQLIYRAAETNKAAASTVARLKRKVGRGSSGLGQPGSR